jgi:hypothetical protein
MAAAKVAAAEVVAAVVSAGVSAGAAAPTRGVRTGLGAAPDTLDGVGSTGEDVAGVPPPAVSLTGGAMGPAAGGLPAAPISPTAVGDIVVDAAASSPIAVESRGERGAARFGEMAAPRVEVSTASAVVGEEGVASAATGTLPAARRGCGVPVAETTGLRRARWAPRASVAAELVTVVSPVAAFVVDVPVVSSGGVAVVGVTGVAEPAAVAGGVVVPVPGGVPSVVGGASIDGDPPGDALDVASPPPFVVALAVASSAAKESGLPLLAERDGDGPLGSKVAAPTARALTTAPVT